MSTNLEYNIDKFVKLRIREKIGSNTPTSAVYDAFRRFAQDHSCSDVKLSEAFALYLDTKRLARGKVFVDCELVEIIPWTTPTKTETKTVCVPCHFGMNKIMPKVFCGGSMIKNITLMDGDRPILGCVTTNDDIPDIRTLEYGLLLPDMWLLIDKTINLYILVDQTCTVQISYTRSLEPIPNTPMSCDIETSAYSANYTNHAPYHGNHGNRDDKQYLLYTYKGDTVSDMPYMPKQINMSGYKGYNIPPLCHANFLTDHVDCLITEVTVTPESYIERTDNGYYDVQVITLDQYDIVGDIRVRLYPTQTIIVYPHDELDVYQYLNTKRIGPLAIQIRTPCDANNVKQPCTVTYNGICIKNPLNLLKAPRQTKVLQTYLSCTRGKSTACESELEIVSESPPTSRLSTLIKQQPKFLFQAFDGEERVDTYFGSSQVHLNPREAIRYIKLCCPSRVAKVSLSIGGAIITTWTPDTCDFNLPLGLQYYDGTGGLLPFMTYHGYTFEITPTQLTDPCKKELVFEAYINKTDYDGEARAEALVLVQQFAETSDLFTAPAERPISYLSVQGPADAVELNIDRTHHQLEQYSSGRWSIHFTEPVDPKSCMLYISPAHKPYKITQRGPAVLLLQGGFAGLYTDM